MAHNLANVTADALIGDVLAAHPLAGRVIEKYLGNTCFTCPGMKVESIKLGAMMHGVDPAPIVRELQELPDAD